MFVSLFTQHRRMVIAAIVLLALAALGAAVVWQQYFRSSSPVTGSTSSPQAGSTSSPPASPELQRGEQTSSGQAAPPSRIPPYRGEPVAILNGEPHAVSQAAEGAYEKARRELRDLAVSLEANPGQPDGWMRVAYLKHYYEDNIGARDAYEYLNLIAEERAVAYYNLAVLYGYYLKEPAKAAPKFRAAIIRDPVNASFYTGFADFWREVVKDFANAEAVLEEGLSKTQAKANLSVSLGSLYVEMGRLADAIRAYESALADPAMGSSERAAVGREIERLKQAP